MASEEAVSLEQALNLAAERLPWCWEIKIEVEREAGGVALYHMGQYIPFDDWGCVDHSMAVQVGEALDYALVRRARA